MARYPQKVGPENLEKDLFDALNRFEKRFGQEAKNGKPSRYEIRVDSLRVIGPTEDPEAFADLLDFINMDTTTEVEVRVYHKGSDSNCRTNDQYAYVLQRPTPIREDKGLDGFGGKLDAEVDRMRQKIAQEQLQRELQQMTEDQKELENYTDALEKELEKFRERRFYMGEVNMVDLGGVLIEGWVRRNPQIVTKLLGPNALSGFDDNGPATQYAEEVHSEGASFERADADPHVEILRRIQLAFTEPQFEGVLTILDHLALKPAKIQTVIAMLENGPQNI
jgi:hypothetical protein